MNEQEQLTNEEHELVEAIKLFGGTVTGLKQRRFRFTVRVSIGFGVVLALILGIVLFITLVVLPRIEHNTKTVKSVQCSLYRIVLTSGYHPETRMDPDLPDSKNLENLLIYNEGFKTIIIDNNRLGCVKALEPQKYITNVADAFKLKAAVTSTTTLPTRAP